MDIIIERLAGVAGAFLILSLVVEKIADFWKLWRPKLRTKSLNPEEEKEREKKILSRNITVGIVLALFLKADAVQILVSGDPGEVLGWENVFFYDDPSAQQLSDSNYNYFKNLSCHSTPGRSWITWFFALVGIFTTGVALSFGSKFWHDVLGIIYEVKKAREALRESKSEKRISKKK